MDRPKTDHTEDSAERKRAPAGPAPRQGAADKVSDLYGQLYQHVWGAPPPAAPAPGRTEMNASAPPPPALRPAAKLALAPETPAPLAALTLPESGLSVIQVCDLILKQLYLSGSLLGWEIAKHSRLQFPVIDEVLRFLKNEKCIEVVSGELIGRVSYRFNLTELGRTRAREAFEQCRYVGPAPVSLEAYVKQCALQGVSGVPCTAAALEEVFAGIVLRPGLLDELGPAICSGKSIFLYGPPGNGKTTLGKALGRFLNKFGGEIYVPYAVHTEGSIFTIFDATIHEPTDNTDSQGTDEAGTTGSGSGTSAAGRMMDRQPDGRWRRVRRPVVIAGGELTLAMLDLRYNPASNFYQAPLHIKANGGVFLIDDFGRQLASPRDLLNRWILPLEERVDYLTLITGKNFAVPFEQLTIFSTNLDPRELVDEAFLRRIRHKILIDSPSRDLFIEIFRTTCEQRRIPFVPSLLDSLMAKYFKPERPLRSSDPRDLLEIVHSICRFRNQEVRLTEQLLEDAAKRFFCEI